MSLINGNFGNNSPEKKKQPKKEKVLGDEKGRVANFPQGPELEFWNSKFSENLVVEAIKGHIPQTMESLRGFVRLHFTEIEEYTKKAGRKVGLIRQEDIDKVQQTISKMTDLGLVNTLADSSKIQWKHQFPFYLALIAEGRKRGLEYKEN
jgi:hypothetical protein